MFFFLGKNFDKRLGWCNDALTGSWVFSGYTIYRNPSHWTLGGGDISFHSFLSTEMSTEELRSELLCPWEHGRGAWEGREIQREREWEEHPHEHSSSSHLCFRHKSTWVETSAKAQCSNWPTASFSSIPIVLTCSNLPFSTNLYSWITLETLRPWKGDVLHALLWRAMLW